MQTVNTTSSGTLKLSIITNQINNLKGEENSMNSIEMLAKDWYVTSGGINYCMYSVAVKEIDIG